MLSFGCWMVKELNYKTASSNNLLERQLSSAWQELQGCSKSAFSPIPLSARVALRGDLGR